MIVRTSLLMFLVSGVVSRDVGCLFGLFLNILFSFFMLSTIVFLVSVFFVNIDFGWPCSCDKLGSCDCRTSNLFFVGITVGWELLFCFMFSFFSQYASCVSVSSSFILSWLLYFLFLLTRFGGGLSFRVFCAAGLMLLLLSLVVF